MLSSDVSIITIALVLYKRKATESEAFATLFEALNEYPSLKQRFHLVIFDNSPETQAAPLAPIPLTLIGDSSNPGLAAPYNKALDMAERLGSSWLLLLDQDTQITPAFLTELCDAPTAATRAVAAIVPKLLEGARVCSPRRLPWLSPRPVDRSFAGIAQWPLIAYNSGACLRVDAMREIGGFPAEYWLDYLDYAVFHLLQREGGRVQVLHAELKHDLSIADLNNKGSHERFANFLAAERLYYQSYGSANQRMFARFRLLTESLYLLLRVKDKTYARMCALSAFGRKTR